MKKIGGLLIGLLLANTLFAAHTYVSSSVLSSGTFVKIKVSESGLHSISYEELKSYGLNPASVRIYGYGGAQLSQDFRDAKIDDLPCVPVLQDKGSDQIFNAGDRLVFYAQGPVSWKFDGTTFKHTRNTYSDYGYYFLTSDRGTTVEIEPRHYSEGNIEKTIDSYTCYQVHEVDSVNLIDRSGKEGGGREFYGEQFAPGSKRSFSFALPGLISSSQSLSWDVDLASCSSERTTFTISMDNDSASVSADGIATSDFYTRATMAHSFQRITPTQSEQKRMQISFNTRNSSALGFLNYIEINATCSLTIYDNEPLYFRTQECANDGSWLRFRIHNAGEATQVWDVTDLADIFRVESSFHSEDRSLTFVAKNTGIREYVAFNPSGTFLSPTQVGKISNQDLHQLAAIDMVIISPEAFLPAAQRLAAAHEVYDNMSVAVVTDQQVYNEFSSGTPDATAYRWLMKMLYDRGLSTGQQPRYLLLFGDGTFDNRKRLIPSGNNWLLTYQANNSVNEVSAYATDDYFAFLGDAEGHSDTEARMSIGVGRLPVNSTEEAEGVVSKLLRHISGDNRGKWKSQLAFLADDGDGNLHTRCTDDAGEAVRINNPDFIVNKIYLDAYTQEVNASGESYPLAQTRLNNLLHSGVSLFDYCGHSGYNNASSEGLVTIAGIRSMQNDNLGFWIFASCSFALFDAGKTSAAEEAMLNPNGGALAVCAASRTVYASENKVLNRHICDALFSHATPFDYPHRLGDAVRLGKNACGTESNKLAYVLIGDPATSLHFPTAYQVRTTEIADTINALSVVRVKGFLESANGDTASWFNGRLFISVYDKMQEVTTLDNDQPDPGEKNRYTYNDYPNILFQGETNIRDGFFEYTFMVPKDIRYNFGAGRIVYYAQDSLTGEEGVGHYEDFIIGGSSPVQIIDTIGPSLNVYIGHPSFVSGDKTNETPRFFADIEDENGINTVGSGIGHDLLLVIDGKATETFILNDYFSATNNSYQRGQVAYQMATLKEGKHSLSFRAWDLVNNSSTATLDFEVVNGMEPSVITIYSYPNPAPQGSTVYITYEYNRPDVVMQTDLFIYDLSGRLVQKISSRGESTIRWNLSETHTPPGIYLYKIQLTSNTTKTCSKTSKIIIK